MRGASRPRIFLPLKLSTTPSERMKIQRHNAIKDLLATTPVANQDDLRRKLAGRGIHATQATLSRDIREL